MLIFGVALGAFSMPVAAALLLAAVAFLALSTAAFAASSAPGSPAAAPRLDKWKVIGPGGGGAQYIPTVSPHDPKKVLVRCDMTGSYMTEDGGNSWRMFNLRGVVRFFLFDPVDPNTIYAKSYGLYRSTDSGKTWNLVHPAPSKVKRVVMPDDHAGERFVTVGRYCDDIVALAVDPADSNKLYAAFERDGQVSFYTSEDRAETWKRQVPLPGGALKIYIDPRSPKSDRTVYVIAASSASVRTEGKWVHHPSPRGVKRFIDVSAGFPPNEGPPVLYTAAPAHWRGKNLLGGILVSHNGGATWQNSAKDLARQAGTPLPSPIVRGVATCLTDPSVAYIGFKNLALGRGKTAHFGSAKTTDAGKTWTVLVKETDPGKPSQNVKGAWLNEYYGPIWGDAPRYLGVDPNNPDVCFTTDDGRTMRTTDGGDTWRACYSRARGSYWTTTGLDVLTCYGVHFDPANKKRLFISYTDIGLFVSDNGGSTWKGATGKGVPVPWINTTYWMAFDPAVKGRVWAVMTGIHDLPRSKMWRQKSPAGYNGGVVVSNDSGKTWKRSTRGMPETAATHILMDPESPSDARVLYVTGFGTGVWKSTNAGASWKLANSGICGKEPFAWRIARDKNGALYLVVARRSDDGSYGNNSDGALYRSRDSAQSWHKLPLPKTVNGPNDIAVDPRNPNRLYLAAWGRDTAKGAVDGGIYLSKDAGNTWKHVLDKDQHVYSITVDPRDSKLLYATGFESSAWRSQDRGNTWKRIRGFNFKWGHRVIPDPHNPGMIFIATFGGSVWYGPAKGDPKAREDIVTPVVTH